MGLSTILRLSECMCFIQEQIYFSKCLYCRNHLLIEYYYFQVLIKQYVIISFRFKIGYENISTLLIIKSF